MRVLEADMNNILYTFAGDFDTIWTTRSTLPTLAAMTSCLPSSPSSMFSPTSRSVWRKSIKAFNSLSTSSLSVKGDINSVMLVGSYF